MEETLKKIGYLLEMEKRKEGYNQYILSAKNLLDNFSYPQKPFTISFVDKDGVLLLSVSNGKITIPEEGFTFEDDSIKTAIREALEKGSNFEVKRDSCSTTKSKGFSCAASPVKDELGNVIGAISVSAPNSSYPVFALEISSLLANTIQNEVNLSNNYDKLTLYKNYEEIIPDSYNDGILLLDKDKKVLYINNTGASILRINRESSIGKYVIDIVDFTPVILNVFKTGKGYFDKEFFIESPANGLFHFVKTAIVLKDDCGNFTGVIDLFREVERKKEVKYIREIENKCIGADARFTFDDIKGRSRAMKDLIKTAKKVADPSSNILLTGETGTGKEMFAQAIHFESSRAKGPFVAINCGAIPKELAETELFGYESGTFTDADRKGRPGKFELADGGTLFLDEIEEMPLSLQVKLLRVIDDRVITRVGGTKSIKVNVRIIAATNKNLSELVESGAFRMDLYYRLNVIQLDIPPLRKRKEDIPMLIYHFIKKFSKEFEKNVQGFDDTFLEPLLRHDFPGNVRELQNIVERAINIAEGNLLTADCLPPQILDGTPPVQIFEKTKNSRLSDLDVLKQDLIMKVLLETNFNISSAAKKIGISRPTLYRLMKRYPALNTYKSKSNN